MGGLALAPQRGPLGGAAAAIAGRTSREEAGGLG